MPDLIYIQCDTELSAVTHCESDSESVARLHDIAALNSVAPALLAAWVLEQVFSQSVYDALIKTKTPTTCSTEVLILRTISCSAFYSQQRMTELQKGL